MRKYVCIYVYTICGVVYRYTYIGMIGDASYPNE